MKFRFTLTHRGSEPGPFALPALSLWDTQTGPDTEWSTGPVPSVTLPGVTLGGDDSEYLWVDYGFESGVDYSITVRYTKTYLSGIANPRTLYVRVLDSSFATIFAQSGNTPVSPGGTGSVTLSFTANASCTKIAILVSDGSEVTFTIDDVDSTFVDPNDETLTLQINEPDGWRDAIIRMKRDPDYRSLIEFFDGSFIFYGSNGVVNGGIDFIRALETQYGPDVSIEMLIELTVDDVNYETVFDGQLDMSLAEEMMDNKMRIPIIRDNFWAKFMNRKDTPVDLHAANDLDGNAVLEPVDDVSLILTSQIITYFSEYNALYSITYQGMVSENKSFCILNWEEVIRDDVKLFTLMRAPVDGETFNILGLFEAPYDGEYQIEIKFTESNYVGGTWITTGTTAFVVIWKSGTNGGDFFPASTFGSSGPDSWQNFDINKTIKLSKGEQISIAMRQQVNETDTIFGTVQLTWKPDCDVATTATIPLSGEQTIDGVLTSASTVLVKDQGNLWENGIYTSSAGVWTRIADMDSADECLNVAVFVTGGDFQSDTSWRQTEEVGTIDVDAIRFVIHEYSDERFGPFPGYDVQEIENYIHITAKTTFRQTEQPAMLIHDAAAAILKSYGLGETNPFYSELLGSALTNARQYDQDGCAWKFALLQGLQLRGYTLAAKPTFKSFNEWWKGISPILNLGLTYEFRSGTTTDPITTEIQDLFDWDNAGGPFPGVSWNYALFGRPFVSVNGNGGTEGYTCGLMTTLAGQLYIVTTVTEVFESGTNPTNITFIFALLDAGYNEVATQEFTYLSDGFKTETFTISPSTDGTYFALRIINDTTSDTKSLVLRLAVGDTSDQLLLNEEFADSSVWTNEGAGTSWVIGSGEAALTLASGSSKVLTQEFADGVVGKYYFISEYTSTNFGSDSVEIVLNFYDSGNNLVSTKTEGVSTNQSNPLDWDFDSLVVVTKVEIIVNFISGSDIDLVIPYAGIFVVIATAPVVIPDEQVIRVEEVEYFYDPEPSLFISNIRTITRKYDNDKIFNKINIGYQTWKSEDVSGIDDTQTQHIYATRFEKIGSTITLWSEFIAASLAIETTRRKTIAESTDYKFDDSTFIIAINPDDVSPDVYTPELDENFSDIENLLDPEKRYNTRITPARNFLRWRKWLNGCLQNFTSSFYKFVRGEGNFDMVATMASSSPDCLDEAYDGMPLSEKQDIEVTDQIIHLPNYYEMEVPMEWEDYKIVRANRTKAIGISLTDTGHIPLFIDIFDYEIMHGRAKISGWLAEPLQLLVVEDLAATQSCLPSTECDNPLTDEFDEILTTETGVCITE